MNIDVWKDRWVRSLPNYKISFPSNDEPVSLSVNALKKDDDQRWIYDLINELFDEDACNAILQVPIIRFC